MKVVRGVRTRRRFSRPDDDPVTVLLVSSLDEGSALFELRRWQIATSNALAPDREGVTWCKGWGGSAAKALEALIALERST